MDTVEKRTQALLLIEHTSAANAFAPGQVVLFEQFRLLKKTWWWVLLLALAATGAMIWYAYNVLPVQYRSEVLALPPNKTGTPLDNILGGVVSSLKDVGLSKLVGKSSGASGYENSVFFTSRALYDSLLNKFDLYNVYNVPKADKQLAYEMLAGNMDVFISTDGPVTIGVYDESPERAMKMANSVVPIINSLAQTLNMRETEPITRYMVKYTDSVRMRQANVSERLRAFMGKYRLFDPESQAPALSTALMDIQSQVSANKAKVSIFTEIYGAEDPRTAQAVQLLQQSQDQLSRIANGNTDGVSSPNLNTLPSSTVEYMNLRQEYEVNLRLLAIIEPMVTQARFDVAARDIPVLNVLDPAQLPVKKARPKRSLMIASAFVGTLVVAYLAIAIVAFFSSFRHRFRAYDSALAAASSPVRTPVPPTTTQ